MTSLWRRSFTRPRRHWRGAKCALGDGLAVNGGSATYGVAKGALAPSDGSSVDLVLLLEGLSRVRLELPRTFSLPEGVISPRGTAHSFGNAVADPTRYLLVMTPRLHHRIEVLHAGDRDDFHRIFEEHDSDLLS
jgi:hypothetical protein